MPVLNLEYGFLFACNPGTGSTSVSKVLINQLNSQWFPEKSITSCDVVMGFKHVPLRYIKQNNLIDSTTFNKLFKFCFVRNPYTFLVSDYIRHKQWKELLDKPDSWIQNQPQAQERVKIANSCSFQEYLEFKNRHRKENTTIELFAHQVECTDKFYKLEEMDEFIRDFYDRFKVQLKMVTINKTRKSTKLEDNQELLTKEVCEYINKIYEPSFTRYNYSQEI
ncbi:MAG: hypothetical protein DSM107014_15505 [Gomphosphaeria aponina SAG 52.96 = DSM 107014]|uniref:Sulfotransferase family protein n=1 Tax=Gomphosphaeria aponina SAG 52.96 = DSM 107014 TaxID=1521640 RepID=A0A941GWT4_9CHRO|nr:hypothetical protein [Gomphosphaeria aponina SAG 52.96 = DSM 107014]